MRMAWTRYAVARLAGAALCFTVSLWNLAWAQDEASKGAPEISEPRLLEIRQKLASADAGQERFVLLDELARIYAAAGRMSESLKVLDEIVDDSRIGPGRRSLTAGRLALNLALIGDYPRSQRMLERARRLASEAGNDELETLPAEPAFATLKAEAEIARRAYARHEAALTKTRERSELAWANLSDASLSEKRRRNAINELFDNLTLHVLLLVQNNRALEALSYVSEFAGLLAVRKDFRPSTRQRASIEWAYAIALSSNDAYEEAFAAIGKAVGEVEKEGVQPHDTGYGLMLRVRLMIALATGKIDAHVRDAETLHRARAVNPAMGFPAEDVQSLLLAAKGDWAGAAASIGEVAARTVRSQGTGSPFYKYQAALQLLYRLNDSNAAPGVASIERVVELASPEDDWVEASYRGPYVEKAALNASLDALMNRQDPPAHAVAFRIAELLRTNSSQGALTDGAARMAARSPELRALIEQEQLLRFEQTNSRRLHAGAANRLDRLKRQAKPDPASSRRQIEEAAEKEKALLQTTEKLREIRKKIGARFPVYRELVSPSIPDSQQLGSTLRPEEAYVNFHVGLRSTYAFVVAHGGRLHAQRLQVTRAELKGLVASLRKSFDAVSLPDPNREGDLAGFDIAAAHAIYRALIAPVQPHLGDARTVYVSASGFLSHMPWNVLVVNPAANLAEASWWITRAVPVQMPSASALVLARRQPSQPAHGPLLAFADPSFDGRDEPASASPGARMVRAMALRNIGAGPSESDMSGPDYRRIARLPETLDEVLAIAQALGATRQSVISGTQATRSRVLKQDLSASRVIIFATHGLLPGEMPGLRTPGLAMAYEGRGLVDSVLTIDDIIGLRLNADWVVLSACNTGYASGAAGDNMSALARGFFASGARTLLTTQWAVESESAKRLTVSLFRAHAADPHVTKADALARAQRDMLAGKSGNLYRHPYFWAPYFLAGDAAR